MVQCSKKDISFWITLPKPIIGLAPMDGITDPAFRYITDTIGHPNVMYTEFVSAEGLIRGSPELLRTFIHHTSKIPLIGQLFGADCASFHMATILLAELGISGIDINMGCPNKHITKNGGGASLIQSPNLAIKIIQTVKHAIKNWNNGIDIKSLSIPQKCKDAIHTFRKSNSRVRKSMLPVSVKTRIGYDSVNTRVWISQLLKAEPDCIVIHGRTFSQQFSGSSNWEEIAIASELCKNTRTILLGNGDIQTLDEAKEKASMYSSDGVLIGRACCGNPWIFKNSIPTPNERIRVAIEHCRAFEKLTPKTSFASLKKHLSWYCKNFPNAGDIRNTLMHLSTLKETIQFLISLSGTFS